MPNLILSADDFGINQKTNNNILELIRLKKIDRVAILVDGLLSQSEINQLVNSGIKLDIHLNLDKLSKKKNSGKFKEWALGRIIYFLYLYSVGSIGAASAEVSWEEQVSKFEKLFKRKPDGANSHQHIHFFPVYFKVLLKICKKHRIGYLRFGRNCLRKNINFVCFILNTLRLKNLKIFSQSGIATSELLVSLDWIDSEKIEVFFQSSTEETVELVCHPEREKEFKFLKKF